MFKCPLNFLFFFLSRTDTLFESDLTVSEVAVVAITGQGNFFPG